MRRLVLALSIAACKPAAQPAAQQPAPDAGAIDPADSRALLAEVDRLKDQVKDRPKTFEILFALGNLYYDNGRYLDAVDTFREAEEISAPVEAEAQALRDRGVKPSAALPVECRRSGPEYGLLQIAAAAQKLDPPRRLRCLDAALEMAWTARARRGNSFYLIGNPESALSEHRKVLAASPDQPESLFFVGAILLERSNGEKATFAEGKKYWERLLKVAPDSPRAPLVRETLPKAAEVFKPRAEQGPTPEQVRNMQEAVANTERTPELEKGLDALLAEGETALDQGKYQEARDAIVRVMPIRPGDARTAAAMGGAMRGLGRTEMAERTLSRALQLDPRQPRALYEMGKLLAARGDRTAAAQSFAALRSAAPEFARIHHVDDELKRLR